MSARKPNAEQAEWEAILASEGMPEELPPNELECLESEKSFQAARHYADIREMQHETAYNAGRHRNFANALSHRYGISFEEAEELISDAFAHNDRMYA